MGWILDHGMALVPLAISAHGTLGSLFQRMLYGSDALPSPHDKEKFPNAAAAYAAAHSRKVPRVLLERADEIWRGENPDTSYSESYLAMTPTKYYEQQIGLVISTAVSSHLLRAHNKNRTKGPVKCMIDPECRCDGKPDNTEIPLFCPECTVQDTCTCTQGTHPVAVR